MADYFFLQTGLSRGQDDATAKKSACSWWRQYFRLEPETRLLGCVNECEDGLMWFSPFALFSVPARAVPITAEEYKQAEARYLKKAAEKRAREAKEKAFRKQLASGDIYGLRTAEPAPEPTFLEMLNEVSVQVYPPAVEAAAGLPGLLDDYTMLDTEFVPAGSQLLEVAAIRYRNGQAEKPFQSFVHFDGPIPRQVLELTGITSQMLAKAPNEKAVLGRFRQYAGDSLLVAHNVSADRRIIEATRTRLGATEPLANEWLCTMALARKRRPKEKYGLGELCHDLGIATHGAHRALRDVEMCAAVLRYFHEQRPVEKADLHGAPLPSKSRKITAPAGPGLFVEAA